MTAITNLTGDSEFPEQVAALICFHRCSPRRARSPCKKERPRERGRVSKEENAHDRHAQPWLLRVHAQSKTSFDGRIPPAVTFRSHRRWNVRGAASYREH